MVKPDEFSNGCGGRGPGDDKCCCTLCVCFLGDTLLTPMRTLRSKLLLGKKVTSGKCTAMHFHDVIIYKAFFLKDSPTR